MHQPKSCFPKAAVATPVPSAAASCAAHEIHSYLAVRDLFLRQAEDVRTEASLHRVWRANEFAEQCLQPARSPYQAQSLPDTEAARERQRCKAVKLRIAELRAHANGRRRAA